jgi:hypothetical protein
VGAAALALLGVAACVRRRTWTTSRSGCVRIGQPGSEGARLEVEHHVAQPLRPQPYQPRAQLGVLALAQRAAQTPLDQTHQEGQPLLEPSVAAEVDEVFDDDALDAYLAHCPKHSIALALDVKAPAAAAQARHPIGLPGRGERFELGRLEVVGGDPLVGGEQRGAERAQGGDDELGLGVSEGAERTVGARHRPGRSTRERACGALWLVLALLATSAIGVQAQGRDQGAVADKAAALAKTEQRSADVVRLYGEGKDAQATPLAEQALSLREGALGRKPPNVAHPCAGVSAPTTQPDAPPRAPDAA